MLKSTYIFSVCSILFLIGVLLFLAPLHPAYPHSVNGVENHSMVDILDPELRKRVAASFVPPKAPTDPITADDMKLLTSVLADREDIRHLTGLEHAINLTRLQLIRDFPRTQAELNARPRWDLTPLSGLTELESLNLQSVVIFDMSPVANLTKLKYLGLSYTYGISEIPDLSKLTALVHLILHNNRITDISGVRELTNLRGLALYNNRNLSDISPLTQLSNLELLRLDSTAITHESLSAVLPHLSTEIDQEPIEQNMEHVFNSGTLGFGGTDISDLSVLDRLPNVFLFGLVLSFMGTVDNGTLFFHLTDLTPLVDLMNKEKVINSETDITLEHNYGFDYPSLYEDLPALIAGSKNVSYARPTPMLEREFPKEEFYRGHPRTRYTFSVRAVNTNPTFPESWLGSTPHGTAHNRQFENVPVTFTVTNPDGTTEEQGPVLTGDDGLARVHITLGNDGETHTVEAVVPAKTTSVADLSHPELRVRFTVTADSTVPPPRRTGSLTVTFEDYPEERPIDEFTLTIKFSEPVTGFEKADITVETELTSGEGTATLVDLTPETPVRPDRPEPDPVQRYFATVELPERARGTVRLIVHPAAATGSNSQIRGPLTDTPSDPIKFGRSTILVYPSYVAMDKIVFNEFRNAVDDKNDWIELKNISNEPVSLREWEVSLVLPHAIGPATPQWEIFAMDREVVAFPDYTLPPGGVLLIVNTDPSENDLIRGQDIANPKHTPDRLPHYLLAPDMKLPQHPYLLILRSQRDQNGKPEALEDLLGNYHKYDLNYRTQVWPLRNTLLPLGTGATLTESEVYQRVIVSRFTSLVPTRQPEKRGYLRGAWTPSETASGLGYRPGAPVETSLGTPGYPDAVIVNETGTGQISISEVMFATDARASLSQWIELYNTSAREIVNLEGWQLRMKGYLSEQGHWEKRLILKTLEVLPNQTVLLVSRSARTSENIPARRIYDVSRQSGRSFRLGVGAHKLLESEGFLLELFSAEGVLVDRVGNLSVSRGREKVRWVLPSGWTESGERSSLIRVYEEGIPARGTVRGSWVRASDTALLEGYSYWGLPTDNGTPGYRRGSPLPVTVSSVRASRTETGVVVNWTTESEMENAGFYVLRSQHRTTGFVRVTASLILGAGTTAERHTYTYTDTTAQSNVPYYYRLEEVSLSGERRGVATVRLRGHLSAAGKTLWKWADVKTKISP